MGRLLLIGFAFLLKNVLHSEKGKEDVFFLLSLLKETIHVLV